jgi:hypothetical protein
MSHTMSPTRHDTYVQRRITERERSMARKAARQSKRAQRAAFGR